MHNKIFSSRFTQKCLVLLLALAVCPAFGVAQAPGGRIPTPRNAEIRALYFTGLMAGSPNGKKIALHWRATGGNAIVFDIKDSDGIVSFASKQPLAGVGKHPYIHDLPAWILWLHQHGLYAIARVACFKDSRLVKAHPELAVHSKEGRLWIEHKAPAWLDPSLPAVQQYNINLAKEVAAMGVDEIQFDYIRFPTEGNQKDTVFYFQKADPSATRADIISSFLYHAQKALRPSGVHISIDVFGVMAWYRNVDLNATGQDIVSLAYFCDAVSPMIYPSHFFNFDGYKDPGDAPAHFIGAAMDRFSAQLQDTGVVIRPWLQAFAWRAKTFSPNYIRIQVQTARQKNGNGFLLWNAGNKYQVAEEAMPTMMAKPGAYFQGGYIYPVASTALASVQPPKR